MQNENEQVETKRSKHTERWHFSQLINIGKIMF